MREAAKLIAFTLLIIGTISLLINEFVFDWGRAATLTFAALNLVGLVIVAYMIWSRKNRKKGA